MFGSIAVFEFRYQARQPFFRVMVLAFFLLTFGATTIQEVSIGSSDNVHKNSPFAIAQITLIMSLFYMFVTTAFVANVIVRDDETGFGPIVRVTPVRAFDHLNGRFAGALLAAGLGFLAVPLGIFTGSYMPWVDSELLGPNRIASFAFAYFVLGLPAVLLSSALLFATATLTRSMMLSYAGAIGLLILYTVVVALLGLRPEFESLLACADPFGFGAHFHLTKYWTAAERNSLIPTPDLLFLANRIAVILLSLGLLALANILWARRPSHAPGRKPEGFQAPAAFEAAPRADAVPGAGRTRHAATGAAQLRHQMRFEAAQVLRNPAYGVLLALGLFNAIGGLLFAHEQYGTEVYPITPFVITALRNSFTIIPIIIAIYYAGELVWRDRDHRTHEIVDATAAPDWVFFFPKLLAIALVLISTLLVAVLGGVIVQALKGYSEHAPGEYVFWYIVPSAIFTTLIAILAVFVQTVSPHKFAGWGLMLLYVVLLIAGPQLGLSDHLIRYATAPTVPLSDMNGEGHFWIARSWFQAYWSACGVVLAILSFVLWRRGSETRLSPRLRRLPGRLRGATGVAAALAVLSFGATGTFIYVNTHVWNPFRTMADEDRNLAARERALLRYENAPEPTPTQVRLAIDIHPREARLVTRGEYLLENRGPAPISEAHLQLDRDAAYRGLELEGADLVAQDRDFNFRTYRFRRPLPPGAHATLRFETVREQHGFRNERNEEVGVNDNGTFLNNTQFAPVLGIDRTGFLQDRAKRRRYGLPPQLRPARLEDDGGRSRNLVNNAAWVMSDITVSTDADQTPIAPGYVVSDLTRGGRRIVRFRSEAPILAYFCVQSARYAERHALYEGVDIGVFHHPAHAWNTDRMITAAERGLDYFQASFGPYQFRQIRFVEFPDLGPQSQFAESFANTIPWSEGLGFTAHIGGAEGIDLVTYVGTHELAHQWWAHQEIAARMQGGTLLVETLAQYSALMVQEKLYGPDYMRRFLKYELDRYLRFRGAELVEELPLGRVENQPYIHYRKGAVVMYLLKDQIGEEAVNRALRRFLADWKYRGPPYPSSKDLVARFREEAPAEKQQLITDLFEKITLYDLKARELTVRRRSDGKFDVRLVVDVRKSYADGQGRESPAQLAGESFDIGLFSVKPGERGFGPKNVLLLRKMPLRSGVRVLDLVSEQAPQFAGVDPYNKYIDRNSDDNIIAAAG